MERRTGIMQQMIRQMFLTADPILALPFAEIAGEHRVLIENHTGVVKYSCQEIVTKVCFGYYRICGDELKLLEMTDVRVVVGGRIHSLELVKQV